MAERRSLIDGLNPKPTDAEKAFVFADAAKSSAVESATVIAAPVVVPQTRSPISSRIRSDFGAALKRASLERQLAGIVPNTISDILDEALEPWLKANGYLT
jgi:hypothetical protein